MINWIQADIFALDGVPIIPTNIHGVHGAGLAKEAEERGFIKQGVGEFKPWYGYHDGRMQVTRYPLLCITFPVKIHWIEKADIDLIKESFSQLEHFFSLAQSKIASIYNLPLVGAGLGEGDLEVIIPMIREFAEKHSNVRVVLPVGPSKYASKTRTDSTLQKLHKIKELLCIT